MTLIVLLHRRSDTFEEVLACRLPWQANWHWTAGRTEVLGAFGRFWGGRTPFLMNLGRQVGPGTTVLGALGRHVGLGLGGQVGEAGRGDAYFWRRAAHPG